MNVAVIGTGYVGLVLGPALATFGNQVTCVDIDQEKIAQLKKGIVPIYEPVLAEIVKEGVEKGTLDFSTSLAESIKPAEIIFIAVGTPANPDGTANLRFVFTVAEEIGQNIKDYKIIVDKSTVPVGTGEQVKKIIAKKYPGEFDVVSCPEFLREGSAVADFFNPDRIVIGADSAKAKATMKKLFAPLNADVQLTDIASAEMIKYASNAFLATKISFINEIANICELVGADVDQVAYGMGKDQRIGKHFLHAGIGYGGSCFPKDVHALKQIAGTNGYDFNLLKAVIMVNNNQRLVFIDKVKKVLGDLLNKKIGVLGLAFKAHTDDIRESASIDIIKKLSAEGAQITAYDPKAIANSKQSVNGKNGIRFTDDPYQTAEKADCLLVMTEWPEFRDLDWQKIKTLMASANVLDGRNILDKEVMKDLGFNYQGVGR